MLLEQVPKMLNDCGARWTGSGEACVDKLEVEPPGRRRAVHPHLVGWLDHFREPFDLDALRVGLSSPLHPLLPLTQLHCQHS